MHRSRLLCLAAILVAMALFATISARAQETFVARDSGTTQNLWGVAYGDGQYVAVGEGGTILRSLDGIAWSAVTSGTTNWLLAVTYGHGQWVVVGDTGFVLTSTDAKTWVQRPIGGAPRLNAVIAPPIGFFAVGESGGRYYSPDAVTWTLQVAPITSAAWFRGLMYDDGLVLYSGDQGYILNTNRWQKGDLSSPAQEVPIPLNNPIEGLAVANGTRVGVGHRGTIQTARDTLTWRQRECPTTSGLRGVTAFRGRFIAVGDNGTVLRSETGETWTALSAPTTESLVGIAANSQGLVTVGYHGTIAHAVVAAEAPVIVRQPDDASEVAGGYVTFEVHATGSAPFTYQWKHDGSVLTGETSSVLGLGAVTPSHAGNYTVEITNPQGTAISRTARLSVAPTGTTYSPWDPTFQSADSRMEARALHVMPDDRILIGSTFDTRAPKSENLPGLFRLLANGGRDPSFDVGTGLANGGTIIALAHQSDGKILVGGSFLNWNGTDVNGLIRLMPDGAVDSTFLGLLNEPATTVRFVQVLADDRIIINGHRMLLANGLPDGSFAEFPSTTSIAPVAGGGFLAGSSISSTPGSSRLDASGRVHEFVPHPSFDSGVVTSVGLTPLPDGRVFANYSTDHLPGALGTMRVWKPNGTLDTSFPAIETSWVSRGTAFRSLRLVYRTNRNQFAGLCKDATGTETTGSRVLLLDDEGNFLSQWHLSNETDNSLSLIAVQSTGKILVGGRGGEAGSIFRLVDNPPPGRQPPRVVAVAPTALNVDDGATWQLDAKVSGSGPITFARFPAGATLDGPRIVVARASFSDQGATGFTLASPYPYARSLETNRLSLAFVNVVLRELAFATNLGDATVRRDRPFTLTANVTGSGPITYTWKRNGVTIQASASPSLTVSSATIDTAGRYQVVATGPAGTIISREAEVSVGPAAYIKNLATRARAGEANENLIVGFVLDGAITSPGSILVRGVGPTLGTLGVPHPLPKPVLTLFRSGTSNPVDAGSPIGSILINAAADFGAFALSEASGDTGLVGPKPAGIYSATLSNNPQNISGNGLVEIYHQGQSAPWLTNVSSRARVGTGDNIMIAGLVIEGTGTYPYLIRGIGPALAAYGVTDTLADPGLEIVDSATGQTIASNDNWEPARATDFTAAGAFALPAGSKDAALRLDLPPGRYTALLRGKDSTTGVGLIEIYELP